MCQRDNNPPKEQKTRLMKHENHIVYRKITSKIHTVLVYIRDQNYVLYTVYNETLGKPNQQGNHVMLGNQQLGEAEILFSLKVVINQYKANTIKESETIRESEHFNF